jgi:hypothetical protein
MELAQFSATFQIAFRFRCVRHRCDYSASSPAFVLYSVFVLWKAKYRLGPNGLE